MTKTRGLLLLVAAGILPWLVFSDSLHLKIKPIVSKLVFSFSHDSIDTFIANKKNEMVKIPGGSFVYGRFDHDYGGQRYAYIGSQTKQHLSEVDLKDFSMARYQITYDDYDAFTHANDLPPIEVTDPSQSELKEGDVPALLTWQQASDYCQWLGIVTQRTASLPTDAQWEYAARSGGKFILYPTDSGIVEPGRNVPAEVDKVRTDASILDRKLMPVGSFPPNPIGIYDLASNGREWTQSTYKEESLFRRSEDKYKDHRFVRSFSMSSRGGAPTVFRTDSQMDSHLTARCVMNSNPAQR